MITARETSKPLLIPRFRGPSLRSSPSSDEEVVFEDFTELSLEVADGDDDDDGGNDDDEVEDGDGDELK